MNESPWSILSEWHNAWLAADPDERRRLRERLGRDHPALQKTADELAATSAGLDSFLARPALVVAAPMLAEECAPLKPATTIGPYRIVELVARGGMGDVYRASDVRLGRDVAIKVLTQTDADSRSVHRFIQEARVTASLDHPNIVKVFDVGMFDGKPFLVAELLDGETLGARIKRGAVPSDDAARITGQVAAGLTVAHEAGLVHRDLKPDNIFLTKSGITKILDFGIAKLAYEGIGTEGGRTLSGVLLGTAGYLAPEQVRGDVVDARADLFALGAIAYEMVTGTRAFAGDHTIDTLHAIVHDPPPGPDAFGDTPPEFVSIVIRLLQKNPQDRFQSAALVREALDDPSQSPRSLAPPARRRRPWRRSRWAARLAGAVIVAGALVAVGMALGSRDRVETATEIPLTRFVWTLPAGMTLDSPPLVSPDGRRIVFAALGESGPPRLMVRGLEELNASAIPGTEGAKQPFWSPRGDAVGFFARGKLMKVSLTGGAPIELADAPDGRGGTWNSGGTIVFAPDLIEAGLFQVPDVGGMARPVTQIDFDRRDNAHRWPMFLPDGVRFLFFGRSENAARRGVFIGRLDRQESLEDPLLRSDSEGVYVPADSSGESGHLLYVADGRLEARPFDAKRQIVSGDTKILATPVAGNTPYYAAMFSASRDVLAFVGSPVSYGFPLGSVGRNGESLQIQESSEIQGWPRLSPDGQWLAWQRIDAVEGNPDTWAVHLERGTRVRVTNSPKSDMLAVWSPDSRRMAYVTDSRGKPTVAIAAADGTGVVRTFPCPGVACETNDWSSDGKELILTVHVPGGTDVWTMPVDGTAPRPLLANTFVEHDARLSPDGQWIAYVSNETKRSEVSVRSRSGNPRRIVISSTGGTQPVWRRDGAELFFVDPAGRLSAVPVRRTAGGEITLGVPAVLSGVPLIGAGHWNTQYDVSKDGRRVYFMDRQDPRRPATINVVLGWRTLLR